MLSLLLMLPDCLRDEVTPFPAGLEPIESCSAGFPESRDGDPSPESISTNSGERDDFKWASGCGFIDADVQTVWAALQDPDVVTDRRRVTSWELTEDGHEPDYDVSFRVHNVVEDILTVDYDIDWRQGVWEGEAEDPHSVVARWQKTDGVAIIELLEGSIVLEAQDDGSCSLDVVEHLDAPGYSGDELEQYLQDLHASIVASVDGQPLPDWQ